MKVLYIGGFQLPDKNAAAQRVVNIAKAIRDLNFEVYFLNAVKDKVKSHWTSYFNFECFEYSKHNQIKYLTSINVIKKIIKEKHIDVVIAYNYPSIALSRLVHYCNMCQIQIYGDVTEWYVATGNIFFRLIKSFDSNYRMKVIHPKMDGLIVISEYLYKYYKNKVYTTKIPPTVDITDTKWYCQKKNNDVCTFVYAGQPNAQKERLDLIVEAIERVSNNLSLKLKVVGITKSQFEKLYKTRYCGENVLFYGRMSHIDTLDIIKKADWTIIVRDNNLVTMAGFPTKVVESISCKTPVLANNFSNIQDYLTSANSLIIDSISEINKAIIECVANKNIINIDCSIFDYHNYIKELDLFLHASHKYTNSKR